MLRTFSYGIVALAIGIGATFGDFADAAQKGGGGNRGGGGGNRGGGGGGNRGGGASRSSPAPRSAPSVRSAPAPSFRSSPAPSFRSSPAPSVRSSPAPSIRSSPAPARVVTSPSGGQKNEIQRSISPSKVIQAGATERSGKSDNQVKPAAANLLKSGGNNHSDRSAVIGDSKRSNKTNDDRVKLSKPGNTANSSGKNEVEKSANVGTATRAGKASNQALVGRNAYVNNNYRNYYGNGYYNNGYHYRPYCHRNNNFWQYLLYASIFDRLGFGYSSFGWYPYSYGFSPYPVVYGYDDGPYYASPGPIQAAPLVALSGKATIEVRLPDADGQVWIDGRETSSRGVERSYSSPRLEGGYDYTYSIKAMWEQDGETRTVERQITIVARDHVVVDFTRSPARVFRPDGNE